MRAESAGGEERALEVDPDDPWPVARRRNFVDRREQLLLGRRDEGGEVGGDAGLEQCLAGAPVAGGVRVEEVDAAEAVYLEIDEPRRGDAPAVPAREPDRRDPAVGDLDVSA